VAFGDSLNDAAVWVGQLLSRSGKLVSLATDGESYGHHRKGGDRTLAAVIATLRARPDVTLENYSSYLARHPATQDVKLIAPTSWSCAHGVERWRSNCGCKMAFDQPSQQRWRTPLRNGLNWLAGELHRIFERESAGTFADPWAARDAYGQVVGRLDRGAKSGRERDLLELERNAMRMFTSCGWFFDDIAGIEAVQILRYAARAIDLAGAEGPALEAGLLERLAAAESNAPGVGSGRDVFRELVRGRVVSAGDEVP
jgi:alpha-amylase/alpha-mannosidase (GH57 family)